MNILDCLPVELLSEVFLYLNIDDINNINEIIILSGRVIESINFWLYRLTYDSMKEYIRFFKLMLNTENKGKLALYSRFITIEQDISKLLILLKETDSFFSPHISREIINIDELISYDLDKFKENVGDYDNCHTSVQVIIEHNEGRYKYSTSCDNFSEEYILSYDKLKLLLIKFSLTDFNIFDLSFIDQ